MIKRLSYIFFLVLVSTSVIGQTESSENDGYVLEGDDYVLPFDSLETTDKMHYSFAMGAGFGRSSTYGNYFSTYYKPMVSYDVSPRLSINTGITYVNSSVDNVPVVSDYSYQLFSGNISQYNAFVGAQYKLTDKLSVGGSVFYDFSSFTATNGATMNSGSGLENVGYSANFQYKVRDGFYIEGEIRVNDKNPYNQHSSRFSNGFMGAGSTFFGR